MISDKNFADWHSDVLGYGYGTGEKHWIPALHALFSKVDAGGAYDFRELEAALGPLAAWLFINIFCGHSVAVFEYGTSPRFGWLTPRGHMLREYALSKSVDELETVIANFPTDEHCMPDYCNCTGRAVSCNPLYW